MDLGFLRRGLPNGADRLSARLDYGLFTASLQVLQSATVTARTQARSRPSSGHDFCPQDALVEILLGGPRWREAVEEQGGSFNAARALGQSSGTGSGAGDA